MQHNRRFIWLDLIRGLSALAVCAGHLRGVVFEDYTHHAVARVWQQGRAFQWTDYATARLTRLWTVLLPALAVTMALDLVTGAVSPDVMAGRFNGWNSLSFYGLERPLVRVRARLRRVPAA